MSRTDRFDQLCEMSDEYWETNAPIEIEAMYAKMMRREHRALVRAVTRLHKDAPLKPEYNKHPMVEAYRCALGDVLALLAKRKGRTR